MGKLLIAVGTGRYDNLPEDLQRPKLQKVVNDVTNLFTGTLGYNRVLEEISTDPTSCELRGTLDNWFASNERNSSDWVVFYYTGHGELLGSETLYLLTRDYRSGLLVSTAFSVSQLGDMLVGCDEVGENRKVRRFLFILDTCHSGAGVLEVSRKISSLFSQGITGGMFYLLAAAFPNEECMGGALASALIESLQDESLGGSQQELIFLDGLYSAINRRLLSHKVVYCSVASPEEEPQFFPNPRYVKGLPLNATVEDIRRAAGSGELKTFWGPISRGVEFEQQPGWHFTGRERVLQELSKWLHDRDDTRTRVITGSAGSGKSAILSKIVTLSDPEYSHMMPRGDKRWKNAFPPQNLNLAIYAKGKTLDEIIGRFAHKLGVESNRSQVLDALKRPPAPFHVVLDALDEAREPTRIVQELLEPLNSISNVKLLIGTRPEYMGELGNSAVKLHIDRPEYLEKSELAKYVEDRLLRRSEQSAETPYRCKEMLARQVAKAVAEKAYPNFLIARLVSENLLASPRAVDQQSVERGDFPDTVGKAFEQYLSRYGDEEQKVRDLLTPLAWAEGLGLPWGDVWSPLASALSQRPYQNDDIRWLLQRAGSFVVESLEQNRSVYRLYHQALADYLRQGREREQVQRLIVETLVSTVPLLANDSEPDWSLASSYVRTHLAEHAAGCGMLADLVSDPLYLLAADSNRLMPVLAAHGDQIPRNIVHVYKGAVHHVREKLIGEAASYLEMNARQSGLTVFATRIAQLPLHRPWSVPWAAWSPHPTPSQAFGKGDSEIRVLEAASWGSDRPVALIGRADGSVEVWDIANGARLVRWKPDGVESVRKLALTETRDGWLLIASWYTGQFGVFNLTTSETSAILALQGRSDARITALCVAALDGQPICVTAHHDLRLAIWDLPSLNLIKEQPNATNASIYCLHVVQRGSDTLLLSGGESYRNAKLVEDSPLRMWSLKNLAPIWEDRQRRRWGIYLIEIGLFFDRTILVTSGIFGPLQVWDLDSGRIFFQDDEQTMQTWLHEFQGETFLISECHGKMSVRRLVSSGTDLTCIPVNNSRPIQGDHFSSIVDLHGRAVLLSSVLDHVRIWDLEDLLTEDTPRERDSRTSIPPVKSLAASATPARELYLGTSYGKIIAVDATTGDIRWEKLISENVHIKALAVSPEQHYLVAGTSDGFIHMLDTASLGSPVHPIAAGEQLEELRVLEWQGSTLAFATVRRGRDLERAWEACGWNLQTGEKVTTGREYRLFLGEEDKTMAGLAVSKTGEVVRLAFASSYGKVMVADFGNTSRAKQSYCDYNTWFVPNTHSSEYINSLATGWNSNELLLAAGTDWGHLAVWHFLTGDVKSSRANAHLGEVSIVCFHVVGQQEVLVSGGKDGFLRFWTMETQELRELFAIEIGERINDIVWVEGDRLAVGTNRGVLIVQLNIT